jgi:hypothetical protein
MTSRDTVQISPRGIGRPAQRRSRDAADAPA